MFSSGALGSKLPASRGFHHHRFYTSTGGGGRSRGSSKGGGGGSRDLLLDFKDEGERVQREGAELEKHCMAKLQTIAGDVVSSIGSAAFFELTPSGETLTLSSARELNAGTSVPKNGYGPETWNVELAAACGHTMLNIFTSCVCTLGFSWLHDAEVANQFLPHPIRHVREKLVT